MGKLLENDSIRQRLNLEPGLWRHSVESAYMAWNSAQHAQKARHLLTGPALTWAENWMMSSPETCSPGMRQFIVRSLEKQASEQAIGRSETNDEDLKKESKFHWAIIALAAFMVFSLSPHLFRGGLEGVINGPPKRIIVNKSGNPTGEVIVLENWSQVTPVLPQDTPNPAGAPSAARDPELTASVIAPTVVPQPATLNERIARLTELSQIQGRTGSVGKSVQLALEAVDLLRGNTSRETEPAAEVAAASNLLRALATSTSLENTATEPVEPGTPTISQHGHRVLARTRNGAIAFWDLQDGSIVRSLAKPGISLASLRVDPLAQRALVPAEDYGVTLLSLTDGQAIRNLVGHETDIVAFAFDNAGRQVLTASRDRTAKVWDTQTGTVRLTLLGHDAPLSGADFSPDGERIVTFSEDRTARIWRASDGKCVAVLEGHDGTLTGATFSPDGARVATISVDGLARLFDSATGQLIATLTPRGSSLMSAAFGANGDRLATLDQKSRLQVWNGRTGQPIADLANAEGPIRTFTYSPDAELLVAVLWNGTLSIWEMTNGSLLASLAPTSGEAVDARFDAGGTRIFALTRAGTIESWPALRSIAAIVKAAKAKAGDCLTPQERRVLGLDGPPPHWCPASIGALGTY